MVRRRGEVKGSSSLVINKRSAEKKFLVTICLAEEAIAIKWQLKASTLYTVYSQKPKLCLEIVTLRT
jgi:hypothetical protein